MKVLLLLCLTIASIFSVQAQYCSTKKGATAYYTTLDEKGKTLKDTMSVVEVLDKGDRLIIKQVAYGDSYDAAAVREGEDVVHYIYYKNQDLTEVVMLDGELEDDPIKQSIYSRYSSEQKAEAEREYQQYAKAIHAEGRISVPLKTDAQKGEKIPECSYLYKAGAMKMKAFLKGKYGGRETVQTPAGTFDCIKISCEMKGKVMLFSQTEYGNEWYAEGVGLVKSEVVTKKGKVLSTQILEALVP